MTNNFAKSVTVNDAAKAKHQALELARNPQTYFPDNLSSDIFLQRKSACTCGGGCPGCVKESDDLKVQAKLAISTPGDEFEQEADRVADQVMRMPDTAREPVGVSRLFAPSQLSRACLACEEGKYAHQQTGDEREERHLQSKGFQGGAKITCAAEAPVTNLKGGRPLSAETRAYFEPRFGHDFSRVLVHADGEAANVASTVSARAYTLGHDIVFGSGEYAPTTAKGMRLLAHELAHVVQQSEAGAGSAIQGKIQRAPAGPCTPPTGLPCDGTVRGPGHSAGTNLNYDSEAGKGDRLLFQSQEFRTGRGRVPLEKRYCPR